ncbi:MULTISPECIES: sensor histidine kinase [unclassified Streptomyces]|uniref:histidine kinase n=1 Tax=Streptomyces sp. NBC_00060 TaxID=2975636 RepID=A0AAU2GQP9_9ACTN
MRAGPPLVLLAPCLVVLGESWETWRCFPHGQSSPVYFSLLFLTPPLLLLRKRFPLAVFLLALPVLCTGAFFAPLVPLYEMARRYSSRTLLIGCGSAYALIVFFVRFFPPLGEEFTRECLSHYLVAFLAGGVQTTSALALGMLMRARRELAARLVELTQAHEREKRLEVEQVLAAERARLAREMHDVIAHDVSLISVQAGALQVTAADQPTREAARTVRRLASHTLEQLRHLLGVLRTPDGTADRQPTLADIPHLLAESGLDVTSRLTTCIMASAAGSSWTPHVQHAAFRTVQEALTNIRKHAPGARVHVRLHEGLRRLHVEVRNGPPDADAKPSALPGSGLGLDGLLERARLLGGTFEAYPLRDGGFLVRAVFSPRRPAGQAVVGRRVAGAPAFRRSS